MTLCETWGGFGSVSGSGCAVVGSSIGVFVYSLDEDEDISRHRHKGACPVPSFKPVGVRLVIADGSENSHSSQGAVRNETHMIPGTAGCTHLAVDNGGLVAAAMHDGRLMLLSCSGKLEPMNPNSDPQNVPRSHLKLNFIRMYNAAGWLNGAVEEALALYA